MDTLSTTCLEKLETFRIKELKDVLTRIGAAKQGKRQMLIDKIMAIVSGPERQPLGCRATRPESLSKYGLSSEDIAKIIDDVYRKMRGSSALDLATSGDARTGSKTSLPSSKCQEPAVRCPCSSKAASETLIQCDHPRCMVWQHHNCVIIPEKEGLKADTPLHFFCEICRIQCGDPYAVSISHPLLPVKMATSVPACEGSSSLQNVEKSFLLSRVDYDLLQKRDYDIQVYSVLLNDKVAFRMHWPLHTELRVNGYPIRASNRPGHQALGINGRDDGVGIADYVREGSNSISVSASDGRPFCIGVRILQRLTVDQVMSRIPGEDKGEPFDTALARVRRCITGGTGQVGNGDDSDSDLEVISESVFVNVRCPMSGSTMKVAGRFKSCAHMGCFDLHTFVELNQRTRKWQCPICLTNSSLDDLIIDPFLTQIVRAMKSYGEDISEVEMKPDGQWRPKLEGDAKSKEPWRLPNGAFAIVNGEHRPLGIPLPLKPVKIEEGMPVEKVPLKIGIKRARDGTWQVKQTKGPPGLTSNGIHDQHPLFASLEYSRSSSMTANTTEVFSSRNEKEDMLHLSRMADAEVNSVPTGGQPSFHKHAGSLVVDPDPSSMNDEVIILSDTEDENMDDTSVAGSTMLHHGLGTSTQHEAPVDQRDLDMDIPFLEMEPFQENTVNFFEGTRGEAIAAPVEPWLVRTPNLFEAGGPATSFPRSLQRPRSSLPQASRRPTHGALSKEQSGGRNGTQTLDYEMPAQYHGELVENPRELVSADPSLQLFLSPQPAKAVAQHSRAPEATAAGEDLQQEWFSLSLGGAKRMPQNQPLQRSPPLRAAEAASRERFDPMADPAAVLLNLSSQGAPGVRSSGHRSVHRSRNYFRVDSDSDD